MSRNICQILCQFDIKLSFIPSSFSRFLSDLSPSKLSIASVSLFIVTGSTFFDFFYIRIWKKNAILLRLTLRKIKTGQPMSFR
jgi:hypothetical protein